MALIRKRALQPEPAAAQSGALLEVGFERWLIEREALLREGGPLALRVSGGDDLAPLAGDLARFAMVVLDFASFNDGRGLSQARLLRDYYGYAGELRATGALLPDQLRELERCGVDSVDFLDESRLAAALASYGEIDVAAQPASDGGTLLFRRRFGAEQPQEEAPS